MTRWVSVSLGLALAAFAFYLIARRGGEPPHEEIDAASRARLESVLREAEEGESP